MFGLPCLEISETTLTKNRFFGLFGRLAAEGFHRGMMAKTDKEEVEELQGMFGGIPRGWYIKLQVAQSNRHKANVVRKDREELNQLMAERQREQDA